MLHTTNYNLTIGWLYPDLMSIYGDRGNIIALTKRCELRGIHVTLKNITIDSMLSELRASDFLFMGGAQDSQQQIVEQDLKENKGKVLKDKIENGTPGLYICGAFQMLGKYYKEADGKIIEGLSIFDLFTENPGENHKRLIGNMVIDISNLLPLAPVKTLVGFENHGGRTYLGKDLMPIGEVIKGYGNNGIDMGEEARYQNSFGSYSHGPILPKNPHFTDFLITKALEIKYKKQIDLSELDDSLAYSAHKFILRKLGVVL